jgi:uncharacterized membrane protein
VPGACLTRPCAAVAGGFEVAGVTVIVLVSAVATVRFVRRAVSATDWIAVLPLCRADLGRGVLLGLELLVAVNIVGTVAVEPGFASLGVLALVILIRTFLSISFGVEIDGRQPWRRAAGAKATTLAEKSNTGD